VVQSVHAGVADAFVARFSNSGSTLVFATFLGGSAADLGRSVALDSGGSILLTGATFSANFPVTAGAFDTTFGGGLVPDAFVAKLSSDGSTLQYSTFLGGTDLDVGLSIAVDSAGEAHVAGTTLSPGFPVTASAFQSTYIPASDAFYVKVNSTGTSLSYGTFIGGAGCDGSRAIAVDSGGAAYVAVCTGSDPAGLAIPTTPGVFQPTYGGGTEEVWLGKFDSTLSGNSSLVYGTFLGSSITDQPTSVAVASDGSVFVVGFTNSPGFPITPGSFGPIYHGAGDGFVTRLTSGATGLIYSGFLGDSGKDQALAIRVDAQARAFVGGSTESSGFPVTSGAFDTTHNGQVDAFVGLIGSVGATIAYATFVGGGLDDQFLELAFDPARNVLYAAGSSDSPGFPSTVGVFDPSANGGLDGVLSKFSFR